MRRIAHISDLHFGCTDPAVVEGLLAELNADQPDLVIASGDFTMKARRREFKEARAFLDKLSSPWFAIPGNHDIPYWDIFERFLDPFFTYRAYIRKDLEPVWSDGEIGVVGINTARRAALERNWSHGRISVEQIQRTKERLEAFPKGLFKIVVGHHPFMPPPYAPETRIVGRAEEALACFDSLGVKLVLAGHLHRGYASFRKPILQGETLVGQETKSPEKVKTSELLIVQASSATSTRLRGEPNAYNRIKIENGQARLEPRIWDGQTFVSASEAPAEVKAGEAPRSPNAQVPDAHAVAAE
jgi:3',5'-cyclic AMP phosphodiesterase CpdA